LLDLGGPPAPPRVPSTFGIVIKGEAKKEQDERFYVNLSGAIGGAITDSQGAGTILNDDGGGRGNGKGNNRIASSWAVDAAIEELMNGRPKKRGR